VTDFAADPTPVARPRQQSGDGPVPLERTIEVVLTVGLMASAVLLLAGLTLHREPLLKWGILMLMTTPVARAVVVTVGLLRAKDWLFAAVSIWILAVLGSSLYLALGR
jgi:uncharacterized membrane protein